MKKNRIFSRVLSGALAGALALSLSACGSSSTASSDAPADGASDSGTTHLRLIYSPSLCAAPMYIAIENGYFEEENLDIEQVTVDAAHVSEAIGADQVDVGMGLIAPADRKRPAHQVHHRPAHRLHQAARPGRQRHQEHR